MKILLAAALCISARPSFGAPAAVDGFPVMPSEVEVPDVPPPSQAFPPPRPDRVKCFESEDGCASVSNIYVVYRLRLRGGGDCAKFADARGGALGKVEAEACVAARSVGGVFKPSERVRLCEAVHNALRERASSSPSWVAEIAGVREDGKAVSDEAGYEGADIKDLIARSESDCRSSGGETSWFEGDIELAGGGGEAVSSAEDGSPVSFERCGREGGSATYYGNARGAFDVSLRLKCRKEDGGWKAKKIYVRIDRPAMRAGSAALSATVGTSLGGVEGYAGLTESGGAGKVFPFSEWREFLDVSGVCGSDGDKAGDGTLAGECRGGS